MDLYSRYKYESFFFSPTINVLINTRVLYGQMRSARSRITLPPLINSAFYSSSKFEKRQKFWKKNHFIGLIRGHLASHEA